MKTLFIYCLLTIVLLSCKKTDKSSLNEVCTDSCTTVQGRFLTGNNEPIAGISLEIRSESRPSLGLGITTIRKIAAGKTDNNGYYSFVFSLKPGEYFPNNRYVFLKAAYDSSRFLPIPFYDLAGSDEFISVLARRDTTITMDYYFASKARLQLRLNNFVPASSADKFYIDPIYYDAGYNRSKTTTPQFFDATQINNEKTILVSGNQLNKVSVVRIKSGITTVSDTMIFTPTNQTAFLTLNY